MYTIFREWCKHKIILSLINFYKYILSLENINELINGKVTRNKETDIGLKGDYRRRKTDWRKFVRNTVSRRPLLRIVERKHKDFYRIKWNKNNLYLKIQSKKENYQISTMKWQNSKRKKKCSLDDSKNENKRKYL